MRGGGGGLYRLHLEKRTLENVKSVQTATLHLGFYGDVGNDFRKEAAIKKIYYNNPEGSLCGVGKSIEWKGW